MRIVEIHWTDSAAPSDYWHGKNQQVGPIECVSVGYLISRTKKHVSITQGITGTHNGGLFAIPTKCITSIKRIKG